MCGPLRGSDMIRCQLWQKRSRSFGASHTSKEAANSAPIVPFLFSICLYCSLVNMFNFYVQLDHYDLSFKLGVHMPCKYTIIQVLFFFHLTLMYRNMWTRCTIVVTIFARFWQHYFHFWPPRILHFSWILYYMLIIVLGYC